MSHNSTRNPHNLRPKSLTVYSNDIVVNFYATGKTHPSSHERDTITEFSYSARKRLAFVAANTPVEFTSLITLTYPAEYPSDGKKIKQQLKSFMNRMRRRYNNPSYLWFLEFQKRGAPHFHILYTFKVCQETIDYVSKAWHDIVNCDPNPKHLAAGTRCENVRKANGARRYAVKYACKMKQKSVPLDYQNCGRFYGYSKDVLPRPMIDDIPIYSEDDFLLYLRHWKYADKLLQKPLKVLYGAALPLAETLVIDKMYKKS